MTAAICALVAVARLDASVGALAQVGQSAGMDLLPSLKALVLEPDLSLDATYAPRLLLRDGGAGVRHSAAATAALPWNRTLQLVASERFTYGRNDFTWDPGATRPFDLIEAIAPVIPDNLFTDSEAGFTWLPARGYAFNLSAGYAAYGGLSAASQRLLPLQHGPQLYAGLDYDLTRVDALSSELYAAQTFASTGRDTSQLKLSQSWQRQLDASTRARLGAGGSLYRGSEAVSFSPVASAELQHALTQRLELRASAAYGPHQSPLTAQLLQRGELSASARWTFARELSLRARAAGAGEMGGSRFLLGALDFSYPLGRDLSFSLGTESVLQQLAGQSAVSTRWLAFTALAYRAQGLIQNI